MRYIGNTQDDGDKVVHKFNLTKEQLKNVILDKDITERSEKPVHVGENLDCIPCDTVLNGGSIDPQGNIYVCNQLQVTGGNVLERSFLDIWRNSDVFKDMRNIKLVDLAYCGSCDLFEFCTRCPDLALLEDGDLCGCSSSARTVAGVRKEQGVYPTQSHIFSKPVDYKGGDEK